MTTVTFTAGTAHGLHVLLWKKSDRRDCVLASLADLSVETGLHSTNVSKLMAELTRAGRITLVRTGKCIKGKPSKMYKVSDPGGFDPSF